MGAFSFRFHHNLLFFSLERTASEKIRFWELDLSCYSLVVRIVRWDWTLCFVSARYYRLQRSRPRRTRLKLGARIFRYVKARVIVLQTSAKLSKLAHGEDATILDL
jgi:hypothetical protein